MALVCLLAGCGGFASTPDDCLQWVHHRHGDDYLAIGGNRVAVPEAEAAMMRQPSSSAALRSSRILHKVGFGLLGAFGLGPFVGLPVLLTGNGSSGSEIAGTVLEIVGFVSLLTGTTLVLTGTRFHDKAIENYNEAADDRGHCPP